SDHAGLVQAADALAVLYLDLGFVMLIPSPEAFLCVDVMLAFVISNVVLDMYEAVRCPRCEVMHSYFDHFLFLCSFQREGVIPSLVIWSSVEEALDEGVDA
ncbi:unnamed protein product, partial [marine sediment metagenome]